MAMNKAERERVERLERLVGLTRSLRWSGLEAPQQLTPSSGQLVNGWRVGGHGTLVQATWQEGHLQGDGHRQPVEKRSGSATQMLRPLYATRRDALVQLRLEREIQFAQELLQIDEAIKREDAK